MIALWVGYEGKDYIETDDMDEAFLNQIFNVLKYSRLNDEVTRKRVACHEAGHLVIAELLKPESVVLLSIRNMSSSLSGLTAVNASLYERELPEYYYQEIKISLASKAATEIVFGETDTGASDDLGYAFVVARSIVCDFCTYGFRNYMSDNISKENVNNSIAMLLEQEYAETKKMLVQNRGFLDAVMKTFSKKDTLLMSDIKEIKEKIKL